MTAPPGPERGDTPDGQVEGDAKAISGQRINPKSSERTTYPARDALVPYGDVLECVMACAGSPTCAWRPYQCKLLIGGDA